MNRWAASTWGPPYAPDFESQNCEIPSAGNDFTVGAINARRAKIEAIHKADNSEFIPKMLAWRCKVCSTMYAHWLDAFECHKG